MDGWADGLQRWPDFNTKALLSGMVQDVVMAEASGFWALACGPVDDAVADAWLSWFGAVQNIEGDALPQEQVSGLVET